MFHDRARLRVKAGRGGDGALSFRREKYVPKGGPDGGDGGPGGNVSAIADADLRDLSGLQRRRWIEAKRGGAGGGSGKHGASGESVELRVPAGTQVFENDQLVADLASPGARVLLARGGAGGRGNRRFATPTRQAPRFAEVGLPGEDRDLELRLKLLADAALVGLPNAGKSSLLRRISNAKPKVAEYPFTTIAPVLGTVDAPDGRQLTVADVPGLIEGASEGAGLGHEFLAHLERARMLVHVIDAADGEPAERWAHDRPRAGGVRRRTGRAPAGRRPEQDRPAVRAARARMSQTNGSSPSIRSRPRRAGASTTSAGASSSTCPSPRPRPKPSPRASPTSSSIVRARVAVDSASSAPTRASG